MSSTSSRNNVLFGLMKDVSEAIRLDRSEKNEDAYRKYLECVLRVSTALLKDLHSEGGHVKMTSDKLKMVKLGQQSMDRIALIVNGRFEYIVPPPSQSKPAVPPDKCPPTSLSFSSSGSRPRDITPSPSKHSAQITSPDSYKMAPQSQSAAVTPTAPVKVLTRPKKMSPMEIAVQQNQQLLSAFKARQKQGSRGRNNRAVSANLSLTLQRKMAENLAIAKAQEEILAKKMKERQQRLEEQAAKRFLTPMGLSEEEQHQRWIYRRVLEFEQEELWMIDERKKLEVSSTDIDVISNLITVILSCDSHPLTEQIKLYQNKVLDKVLALVDKKKDAIKQIKVPLDIKLLKGLKKFTSSIGLDANCKDLSIDSGTCSQGGNEDSLSEENEQAIGEKTSGSKQDSEENVDDRKCENLDENDTKATRYVEDVEENNENEPVKCEEKNIETVTVEVKDDIESALLKSKKVIKQLNRENKASKMICRQVTQDYEKYNQENMDELFDESEDEEENTCVEKDGDDSVINGKQSVTDEAEEELQSIVGSLKKFTDSEALVAQLKNEAYLRHLTGITEDIITSIEKIQVLFVIAFQELDSAEGRDQCNVLLEGFFFQPLWESLLVLFRLANEPKELAIAGYMTDKMSALPEEFAVREKLWLLPVVGNEEYPYETSVKELRGITQCPTMLEKLDCLVRTSKMVLQNVEQYYKQIDAQLPEIGADDLLPVLCYIVARSGLPQIVSECHAMDRFIHEGYMFGEEGYCLTSFQTAINYLVSEGMKNI